MVPPVALASFSMSLLLTFFTVRIPFLARTASASSSAPFSVKSTLAPVAATSSAISLSILSSSSRNCSSSSGLLILISALISGLSISSLAFSRAILASAMFFGIWLWATSLSMTIPLMSSVSSRLFPCFFMTLTRSMSAVILSSLFSMTWRTALTARSAKCSCDPKIPFVLRDAQRSNITAAKILAETVRSTLGPRGMDKMMVGTIGDIVITNDGATIMKEMDVQNPAAKMLVEVSKTQDSEVGDGTTTAVVLAGELLSGAETLLDKDVHPNIIIDGYRNAAEKAQEILDEIAVTIKPEDTEQLKRVALTSLNTKGIFGSQEHFADLAV